MSDDIINEVAPVIQWNSYIENVLARWCDQAKCFEWMHTDSYSYYAKRSRIISISYNILTAVNGLSNMIAGGTTVNGFQLAWIFGSMSVIVSIANMLQEKLAYNTSAAEHQQYSITWGIIRRKIEEEISIPPEARKECGTFLKYIRQDINQVSIHGSVKIPKHIRLACFNLFRKIPNFDIPDICGEMGHTEIYTKPTDGLSLEKER